MFYRWHWWISSPNRDPHQPLKTWVASAGCLRLTSSNGQPASASCCSGSGEGTARKAVASNHVTKILGSCSKGCWIPPSGCWFALWFGRSDSDLHGWFLKMVVPPFHTPNWSFLVGKPMVVGYHHFRKPPHGLPTLESRVRFSRLLPSTQLWDFLSIELVHCTPNHVKAMMEIILLMAEVLHLNG